jgi:DNA-binding MarR family transcriptional regulator
VSYTQQMAPVMEAARPDRPRRGGGRDADLSMELAELFGHTMRRLRRRTAAELAPLGLSNSEARVVRLLAAGPLRMATIADRLGVVPRTVTNMVDGAEAAGLVVRRPDPGDRRSLLVELTPLGGTQLETVNAARREGAEAVFGGLRDSQRRELLALLRTMCAEAACPACGKAAGAGPTPIVSNRNSESGVEVRA